MTPAVPRRRAHGADVEGSAHPIRIDVVAGPDDVVRVGDRFTIKLRAACAEGRKLGKRTLEIDPPSAAGQTVEIDQTGPASVDLVAGPRPGMQQWTFRLRAEADSAVSHEAAALTWQHEVVPHRATLAVWSLPDAAAADQPFSLKAGASSTAGAVLAGRTVEVRNARGETVARAALGTEPWSGTSALLWTEMRVTTPAEPGIATWTAHLLVDGLELAHEALSCGFTVNVAALPEHAITVSVVEATTGAPLDDALVRIGAFRATTDASGRATLRVPKGRAEIVVWKTGYDAPDQPVEIDGDTSVTVRATAVPEEDPDAHWKA